MKIRLVAFLLGLVTAGAPALPTAAHARSPAATPSAQPAALKKPVAKQTRAAAHRSKEDTDPLAEVPSFSAEAVGEVIVMRPVPATFAV